MDIQLQVTEKELEEFPEERSDQISTNIVNRKTTKGRRTTNITTRNRIDTQPATRPVVTYIPLSRKESLDQSSDPIPPLLSLHIQPNLQALT